MVQKGYGILTHGVKMGPKDHKRIIDYGDKQERPIDLWWLSPVLFLIAVALMITAGVRLYFR